MVSELSFSKSVDVLGSVFENMPDGRGKNKQYALSEIGLAAFSVFFMQNASFLKWQQEMEKRKGQSDAETLFRLKRIASDERIKEAYTMGVLEIVLAGIFAPAILFFMFGLLTTWVKSDLAIPPAMSIGLAIFLLTAIGLGGGMEVIEALGVAPGLIGVIAVVAVLAVICGIVFAFSTAHMLKRAGLSTADAWAAGGHYGAVSSATLAVGVSIAAAAQDAAAPGVFIFAGWMPAIYPFMDSPALLTAIIFGRAALAREGLASTTKINTREIIHRSVFGMAVWLLVCSLFIGIVAQLFSPNEMARTMLFFDGMFRGVLALFLIDMGMVAGKQLSALKALGSSLWKIVLIALVAPQMWGLIGIFGMFGIHSLMPGMIGWGDAFVFAAIAGGCSFISAPAAMRIAIPEANPSVYLPMSVALTFPFNVIVGLPIWRIICMMLWGAYGS